MDKPLEIFRAGRHTSINGATLEFSDSQVAGIAAAYDPALHEAPLVVGHPALNAPAYGWVKRLAAEGGSLSAELDQVDPAFAEALRAGRYKKRSASFYTPTSPANPKPGSFYLRHVGFLGAAPPAVKGLREAAFAEGEPGVIEFSDAANANSALWRRLREWIVAQFGLETADRVVPSWDVETLEASSREQSGASAFAEGSTEIQPRDEKPSERLEPVNPEQDATGLESGSDTQTASTPPPVDADRAAALEAREKALAEREQRLAKAEQQAKDSEAARRKAEVASFVESLVGDGARVLPRDKAPLVELLSALPEQTLSFAEEGAAEPKTVDALGFLRDFLSRLPPQVDFAERAQTAEIPDTDDPRAIAQAAMELQSQEAREGRTLSPAAAVRRVLRGSP